MASAGSSAPVLDAGSVSDGITIGPVSVMYVTTRRAGDVVGFSITIIVWKPHLDEPSARYQSLDRKLTPIEPWAAWRFFCGVSQDIEREAAIGLSEATLVETLASLGTVSETF